MKKRRKKYIVIILTCMLLILQVMPVYAEENSDVEWYEMVEEEFDTNDISMSDITPYTLYIVDVQTTIAKLSSSKVGLRADVYCASTVQSISVTFYLQKKSGSTWVNVSSGTSSASTNVSSTAKQATVSGVSSGTYRAKSVTTVKDKNGYSESVTCYSGSISI
ncbi:MAG: hypothetical protein SPF19_01120 [Oliverpabstia sp.]|nr:hypothetical protein [Lachnospiraceae bacterium]MDY5025121.1 hypothetical protein [Oliverpabstia sp.]